MKEYIKPLVSIVELRSEETFGCGSWEENTDKVKASCCEVQVLRALHLNTRIFTSR